MKSSQPLSEIAYACGYRDYTNFARAFRQRFDRAPGVHAQGDNAKLHGAWRKARKDA
jgi:AraC family transcriptional regulator, positive regulator of tynA and feaB